MKDGYFTFYIYWSYSEKILKKDLSEIFHISKDQIVNLAQAKNHKITYEMRQFRCNSQNSHNSIFCNEINLFVNGEVVIDSRCFNNLLLANHISLAVKKEVLIFNESDNPYLWLLIDQNNLYLVSEIEDNNDCILIDKQNAKKLFFEKALTLLPGIDYYTDSRPAKAYYVNDYNLWSTCIREI